jgi:hypothetical protein
MAYSFLQGEARGASRDRVDIACAHADLEAGDTGVTGNQNCPCQARPFLCASSYIPQLGLA